MRSLPILTLVATLIGGAVAAQSGRIIRVPGDHPTVDSALNTATDGDTILVGYGRLPQFTTGTKAVQIVSTSNSIVQYATRVGALPAGKQLSIVGFTFERTVEVVGAKGFVLFDRCTFLAPDNEKGLLVKSSDQVTLKSTRAQGAPAIEIHSSTLLVTGSTITGDSDCPPPHRFCRRGGAGIRAIQSTILLSRTCVTGGSGRWSHSAIEVGGRVESTLGCLNAGSGSPGSPAVAGYGDLVVHPNTSISWTGARAVSPRINMTRRRIPSLRAQLGWTSLTLDLKADPNDLFGLTVSVPGPRLPLGTIGDAWHSPTLFATVVTGRIPAGGNYLLKTLRVHQPYFIGQRLVFQAIAGTGSKGFLLSNPDTVSIY